MLEPFDLLLAGGTGGEAAIGSESADDIGDLLGADTPIQAAFTIGVRDQRGKIRDPAIHLRHRHEVVVAQHVAPIQRDAAADVGAESIGGDGEARLRDEVE